MDKKLNSKIILLVVLALILLIAGYYFYPKKEAAAPSIIEPTQEMIGPKNPTVNNPKNDLTASNDFESISLLWDRDDRAAEYVIFRSESTSGPFAEIGRVPAGLDFRTNASDFTADVQTKTLCYRIEARDVSGRTIRVYESVCVPPWQK